MCQEGKEGRGLIPFGPFLSSEVVDAVELLIQLLEPLDPVGCGWVGAEQVDQTAGPLLPEGVGDPHVGSGRVVVRVALGRASGLKLRKGARQRHRPAGEPGSRLVRQVLAVPGYTQLDQHRGDREGDVRDYGDDEVPTVVLVVVEQCCPHGHAGHVSDDGCHGGCDGHHQDVPVLHVGQLMRHHSLQLVVVQQVQELPGGDHGRVLGIPAGGEGVGHGHVGDTDLGHGEAGLHGQVLHDAVKPRLLLPGHEMDLVGHQRELLGEEVGEHVDAYRYDEHYTLPSLLFFHLFLDLHPAVDDQHPGHTLFLPHDQDRLA